MKALILVLLLGGVLVVSVSASGSAIPAGPSINRLILHDAAADHMNYLLYVPKSSGHESTSSWPLILFLHGSEQRGNDPALLQSLDIFSFTQEIGDFPFIVVAPQCPRNLTWSPTMIKQVLDAVEAEIPIDRDRIYLTGFSMGGYGTWQMAAAYPGIFAAIAPLCGLSDLPDVPRLAGLPIWVFHGEKDVNVPIVESKKMVKALKESGADARFTVYPFLAHNIWTMTYRDSRLYLWFLEHSKPEKSRNAAGNTSLDAFLD
jgi:predicted peptidase